MDIYGGTVMCLEFGARLGTKDIDAVFTNTREVYAESYNIATQFNVPADWLNDQIRNIKQKLKKEDLREIKGFSNISLWIPSAEQMLAMKVIAFRVEPYTDYQDIAFLLKYLSVHSYKHAISIVYKFFPKKHVPERSKSELRQMCKEMGLNGWF